MKITSTKFSFPCIQISVHFCLLYVEKKNVTAIFATAATVHNSCYMTCKERTIEPCPQAFLRVGVIIACGDL